MKIILRCNYGKNSPGDVVDLSKDKAQKLIDEGAAKLADQSAGLTAEDLKSGHAKLTKQVTALEAKVAELGTANETLAAEKAALEAKVAELEAGK